MDWESPVDHPDLLARLLVPHQDKEPKPKQDLIARLSDRMGHTFRKGFHSNLVWKRSSTDSSMNTKREGSQRCEQSALLPKPFQPLNKTAQAPQMLPLSPSSGSSFRAKIPLINQLSEGTPMELYPVQPDWEMQVSTNQTTDLNQSQMYPSDHEGQLVPSTMRTHRTLFSHLGDLTRSKESMRPTNLGTPLMFSCSPSCPLNSRKRGLSSSSSLATIPQSNAGSTSQHLSPSSPIQNGIMSSRDGQSTLMPYSPVSTQQNQILTTLKNLVDSPSDSEQSNPPK